MTAVVHAGADQAHPAEADTLPLDTPLTVRPLSIVADADDFLVGDPARADYVLVPRIGVQVIRHLQSGRTVRQVAAETGPDVDVLDFVATLLELGFASLTRSDAADGTSAPRAWRIQPRWLRPLFARVAWSVYAACALLACGILAARPELIPRSDDVFFLPSPVLSVASLTIVIYILAGVHEACHWAAARAEGLDASLTISRRLYMLAFETDLSQLWSLPRRRRYSALLAGMAFDVVVLCAALVTRLGDLDGWWRLESGVAPVLGAVAFVQMSALAAQFFVFVRTDLYAVLITATGCVNLWRVNQLRLRDLFRDLTAAQRAELADAHARDLEVVRWYIWVYVLGMAAAVVFLAAFFLPATLRLVRWLVGTVVAAQVSSWDFWSALALAAIVLSPHMLTLVVLARDIHRKRHRFAI